MKKTLYALFILGLFCSNASATMIDQFLPEDGSTNGTFGSTGTIQMIDSSSGNILSGERDLGALVFGGSISDPLSVSASVANGELAASSTGSAVASARVILDYDGMDASSTIQTNNHFNLLSTGVEDSFLISVTDVLADWTIAVIAFDQGGGTNNRSASVTTNSAGLIVIPFASLFTSGTGADLTDLGELQFRFTSANAGDAFIVVDYLCTGTASGCATDAVSAPAPAALMLLSLLMVVAKRCIKR